jgi:AcrR family transcriptional regulator
VPEILEAALRVFSEHGYAGASLKRIADAAGLKSPQLLAWYFPSKRELYESTLARYTSGVGEAITDVNGGDAEPQEHLTRLARNIVDHFSNPRVAMALRLLAQAGPSKRRRVDSELWPPQVFERLERYLSQEVERGRLVPHDSRRAAYAFLALIWSQAMARLFPGLSMPKGEEPLSIEATVQLFLRGLEAYAETSKS